MPTPGFHAQIACLWEVTARKAGNVHRHHDFANLTYLDFVLSAAAIAPTFDQAASKPLGQTILGAIRATRSVVSTNTNLGMVLLLAPLATVPMNQPLRTGVAKVLRATDSDDADLVYQAIRLAVPGGLQKVERQDIGSKPTVGLLEAMALAENRDQIAHQYCNNFELVFDRIVPDLEASIRDTGFLEQGIILAQLHLLARIPDSLIARKCGNEEAQDVCRRADQVLKVGWPNELAGRHAFQALDRHLRSRGNQLNPGTTADLLAAGLFVLLRQGTLNVPSLIPWSGGFEYE